MDDDQPTERARLVGGPRDGDEVSVTHAQPTFSHPTAERIYNYELRHVGDAYASESERQAAFIAQDPYAGEPLNVYVHDAGFHHLDGEDQAFETMFGRQPRDSDE